MTTKTAMVRKNQLRYISKTDMKRNGNGNLHSEEDEDGKDTHGAGETE